ncbi:MAG: TetR/AcrR family transcriptional regulator [Pseudolabrys sp.]|nr:TetR/AcrR family transcriptional regulator [Pseudolabrys sp.]
MSSTSLSSKPARASQRAKTPRVAARPVAQKTAVKARRGGRITEARQKEIVALISPLFLDRGYEKVTIDDIVAKIGGSKRTVYERFGGKAGLFKIVIKDYCDSVHRDMFTDVEQHKDIEKQLVAIGSHFLGMILNPNILEQHRLMVSIGRNFPELGRMFFKAGPQLAYELIARWIEKQQAAGKIGPGNAAIMAELFLDMLTGRHQLALLTSSSTSPAEISATVKAAARLFLHGTKA